MLLLSEKKEQFRQHIRKQRNEAQFQEVRKQRVLHSEDQYTQLGMIIKIRQQHTPGLISQLAKIVEADRKLDIQPEDLNLILQMEMSIPIVELLQQVIQWTSGEYFESILEEFKLAERIISMLKEEKDLFYLDEIQYLLGQISQKSMLCQATLIQLQIIKVIKEILPNVEIEFDEQCLSSLLFLLTTFLEHSGRIPFEEVKPIISILDVLCKKLRGINFLDIELEMDGQIKYTETKLSLIMRILNLLKLYIDKSSFQINIVKYPSIWIILEKLCFEVQEQYVLRMNALQILGESLKLNEEYILEIIEKHPGMVFQLLSLLDHHSQNSKVHDCIKLQASIVIKLLVRINNPYSVNYLHRSEFPLQFISFVERESHPQILFHQIEALFYICSYGSLEQCQVLYNYGLLNIVMHHYQQMRESNQYNIAKQLIKLTYAICKHNEEDERLTNFLKQYRIELYLSDIVLNCRHQTTVQRAQTLLKYLN